MLRILIVLIPTLFTCGALFGANILDDIDGKSSGVSESSSMANIALATESIQKISTSKRIFIISNNNASFDKGDFITLILKGELVARAVVAKNEERGAGIKIFKIYNTDMWAAFRQGMDVQILRGDDSSYKKASKESEKTDSTLKDEDDLYDATSFSEDKLDSDENGNRIIKTDNLLFLTYGLIDAVNNDGASQKYVHWSGHWGYQVEDNIWGEISYGQSVIEDYPTLGLGTKLSTISIRAKYTVSAPMYTYIQPYIGYQMVMADSPGAGKENSPGKPPATELAIETEKVDALKKNQPIFGLTILKRLVPGWFAKADLGSDLINIGFGLEF